MNFYQTLGYLVFGSRLKRLSEAFLNDVNQIYKTHKIPFEASWFPGFYLLSEKNEITIREISNELNISHSAASQLISSLQKKGLLKSVQSKKDARKKAVSFTAKGEKLLQRIEPVWTALQEAMETLAAEAPNSKKILKALTEIEKNIQKITLFERVRTIMK